VLQDIPSDQMEDAAPTKTANMDQDIAINKTLVASVECVIIPMVISQITVDNAFNVPQLWVTVHHALLLLMEESLALLVLQTLNLLETLANLMLHHHHHHPHHHNHAQLSLTVPGAIRKLMENGSALLVTMNAPYLDLDASAERKLNEEEKFTLC